jgi:NAD(P)-dependent dehydrogenase (short-subunit alcohol dehydrogenase family)
MRAKRILVTGAASGIGAALVRTLTSTGAHVVGLDIRREIECCDEAVYCDLSEPESIDVATESITGPVDALVNVAGVPGSAALSLVVKVNFLGLRRLTERLLPRISDRGTVINVASTAGANWRARKEQVLRLLMTPEWDPAIAFVQELGLSAITAYDFTKEAVILYSMYISSRERHRGLRVNSVSPGAVETPILKNFYDTMGADLLNALKRQAGGRDAGPEEIARVLALLLDDGFYWMNGTDLIVDGGAEVLMNLGEHAVAPKALP